MFETLLSLLEPPEARTIAWIAGGTILLGFVALAAAMVGYLKVRGWKTAPGRIISSAPGFELRRKLKTEHPRNVRVARIAYQFEANGRTWRSGRVLDSGDTPEDQTERLLAAYPAGAKVTVRYDPRDPSKSALEINHPPKDLALGCLAAILIVVALAAIAILFVNFGFHGLRRLLPDAILPLTIAGLVAGLVFLALFLAFHRRAAQMRRWPTINGRIVSSEVYEFRRPRTDSSRSRRGRSRTETRYMPVVEYTYTVGGRQYSSRSIWDGTEVSGSHAYALSVAQRYPAGGTVTVHYDPAAPGTAALEIGGTWHWALLAGVAVSFIVVLWSLRLTL